MEFVTQESASPYTLLVAEVAAVFGSLLTRDRPRPCAEVKLFEGMVNSASPEASPLLFSDSEHANSERYGSSMERDVRM